jgi:hypothetical protein
MMPGMVLGIGFLWGFAILPHGIPIYGTVADAKKATGAAAKKTTRKPSKASETDESAGDVDEREKE